MSEQMGLDALVEEAMGRKLIPTQQDAQAEVAARAKADPGYRDMLMEDADDYAQQEQEHTVEAHAASVGKEAVQMSIGPRLPVPDATFPFSVNGIKCLITIHVEAGATVSFPTKPKPSAGGVKVKGIRGRDIEPEETEAEPEPEPDLYVSGDKLEQHWKDNPSWKCPVHGTYEVKTSEITKRTYMKCAEPGCSEVAPK